MGTLLMVTAVEARFRRPARYGETVQVACRLDRLGSRGLTFAYEVHRDGEPLATGKTEHVWVDVASNRPCRTPEPLREPFARLAGF